MPMIPPKPPVVDKAPKRIRRSIRWQGVAGLTWFGLYCYGAWRLAGVPWVQKMLSIPPEEAERFRWCAIPFALIGGAVVFIFGGLLLLILHDIIIKEEEVDETPNDHFGPSDLERERGGF